MEPKAQPVCPDCKSPLNITDATEVGEIIECANCGAEIEVLSQNPLVFEILEEEK